MLFNSLVLQQLALLLEMESVEHLSFFLFAEEVSWGIFSNCIISLWDFWSDSLCKSVTFFDNKTDSFTDNNKFIEKQTALILTSFALVLYHFWALYFVSPLYCLRFYVTDYNDSLKRYRTPMQTELVFVIWSCIRIKRGDFYKLCEIA